MTIFRITLRRPAWLLLLFIFLIIGVPREAAAQEAGAPNSSDVLRMTINAEAAQDTISRHIYGLFAEHLGRDIYGGFWIQEDSGADTAETGPPTGPPSGWQYNEPVIEALRELDIPNLRWPGGCFADYYHWRDGIGPRDGAPHHG